MKKLLLLFALLLLFITNITAQKNNKTKSFVQTYPETPLFTEDFEVSNSKWVIKDDNQYNKWYRGTAAYAGVTGHSMYISSNYGENNHYNTGSISIVHFYVDIDFESAAEYLLLFDWRAMGERMNDGTNTDFLQVSLVDTSYTPKAKIQITDADKIIFQSLNMNPEWTKAISTISASKAAGKTKRLVFSWINHGGKGQQPPAAIDNIEIYPINCVVPTNLQTQAVTANSFNVSWNATGNSFNVQARVVGTETWETESSNTTNIDLGQGLISIQPNTEYEVRVQNLCTGNLNLWSEIIRVKTPCLPATIPLEENFDNEKDSVGEHSVAPACWRYDVQGFGYFSNINAMQYTSAPNSYSLTCKTNMGAGYTSLISPTISTLLNTLCVRFQTKVNATDTRLQVGYLTNPTDNSSFKLVKELELTNTSWEEQIVSFQNENITGSTAVVFRFTSAFTTQPKIVYIDDISIQPLPSCPRIEDLHSTSTTSTSIEIAYTSNGIGFYVMYAEDKPNATWTKTDMIYDPSYVITNLSPGKTYQVKVQAICSGGSAEYSNIAKFKTSCEEITLSPSIDIDFDNLPEGQIIPDCWRLINKGGKASLITQYNYSAPYSLQLQGELFSVGQRFYLISPSFSDLLKNIVVRFRAQTTSPIAELEVGYLTNKTDTGSFVPQKTILLQKTQAGVVDDYVSYTVPFNDVTFTDESTVAFRYITKGAGQTISLDNISIQKNNCNTITDIKITDVKQDSIFINIVSTTGNNFKVSYKDAKILDWKDTTITINVLAIGNLTVNTRYEIKIQPICEGNYGYEKDLIYATTLQDPLRTPFLEDFENEFWKWEFVNGTKLNKWTVGSSTFSGEEGKCAYISDNGTDYKYNTNDANAANVTHMYRDVFFEKVEGANGYILSFDWKCNGDKNIDYFQIALTNYFSLKPVAGTVEIKENVLKKGLIDATGNWNTANIRLPDTLAGKTYRLILSWKNNTVGGNQPPAAIDNISITPLTCEYPTNLQVSKISYDTALISWKSTAAEYSVQYKKLSDNQWRTIDNITDTFVVVKNLDLITDYQVRVLARCTTTDTSIWSDITRFTTLCKVETLPFSEDFSYLFLPSRCWAKKQGTLPANGSAATFTQDSPYWKQGAFANVILGPSLAAKVSTKTNVKEWLITPEIDLGNGNDIVIDFNLALTKGNEQKTPPVETKPADKFYILVSSNGQWTINDTVAVWDNVSSSRVYNNISSTGERVILPLKNKTGNVRIAFYVESVGVDNDLFIDDLYIRTPVFCDTVKNIAPTVIADNVNVTWVAPEGQNKWEVTCIDKEGTEAPRINMVYNVAHTTFNKLTRGNNYLVSVKAVCTDLDISEVKYSNEFAINKCDTIANLQVKVTDTIALVTWVAPEGQNKWEVVCTEKKSLVSRVIIVENKQEATFDKLERGLTYNVSIRSICAEGDTTISKQSTDFTISRCNKIGTLTIVKACENSAILEWEKSPEQIKWELLATSNDEVVNEIADTNKWTIKNLLSERTYELKIRPICGVGDTGNYSPIKTITTVPCQAVQLITVIREVDSMFISWDGNICYSKWEIKIGEFGTDASTITPIEVQRNTGTWFKGDPNKGYDVYVRPICTAQVEWKKELVFPLSINQINSENIQVVLSPNPAKDYAKLNVAGTDGDIQMTLVTPTGKTLRNEVITTKEHKINLHGLPKGIYLIHLVHKNWTKTEKLIVQ